MRDIISLEIVHTGIQVGKLIIIKLQFDKQTKKYEISKVLQHFFYK